MVAAVQFEVPGPVHGKGRPRFARIGAGVRAITPEKTRSYEGVVQGYAHTAMGGAPLLECPVYLRMRVQVDVPRSWPAWKRDAALSGAVRPTTKPDVDNCVKLVCDALNGVVWKDDTQVTTVIVTKSYAPAPGLIVTIEPEPAQAAQTARKEGTTR